MRRSLFVVALLFVALTGIGGATVRADQAPAVCTVPRDACGFFNAYIDAFNRRDWEAFRATFSDDITVMFDSPVVSERRDGRAAVEEAFARVFPPPGTQPTQPPSQMKPENLRVQDLGDVVIISFHLRAAGVVSRRTVVLQRRTGGWGVAHIHASSPKLP